MSPRHGVFFFAGISLIGTYAQRELDGVMVGVTEPVVMMICNRIPISAITSHKTTPSTDRVQYLDEGDHMMICARSQWSRNTCSYPTAADSGQPRQ